MLAKAGLKFNKETSVTQRSWLDGMTPPFLKQPKLGSKYETPVLIECPSPKHSHIPVSQASFWALSHAKDIDGLQPTGPWAICSYLSHHLC